MSNFLPVSGFLRVRSFLPLALIALAGIAPAASAQATTPQLLPSSLKTIAGGGTSNPAKGGVCPVSGNIATDAYGDGCLATEVLLGTSASAPGPRAAVADTAGNVYFGDFVTGLVHRVDAITGIMTAVAGGGSSPSTCTGSVDARGDGCLATAAQLSTPNFLTFDTSGNLYFSDNKYGIVRKITGINSSVAAVSITSGGSGYTTAPTVTFSAPVSGTMATGTAVLAGGSVVSVTIVNAGSGYTTPPTVTFSAPTTGTTATGTAADTGIISLVAGSASGTGYTISTNTTTVTAAQSKLGGPYGIALDTLGDLFISDEYDASLDVLNLNATGSNTVNSVAVPAGTIWKIAGTVGTTGTSGSPYCTSGSGCTYNHKAYTEGGPANTNWLYNPFPVAVDSNGYVYTVNEYLDTVVRISPAGLMTTYVGVQNSGGSSLTRGVAPQVTIGSPFGVALDAANNLYFTDAATGAIWRVDATTQNQYVVASGLGKSGTGFATTTLPGPGVFGVSVDQYADLFYGDTEKNIVGEVASGTQFGVVGANQPTNNVVIHFGVGDIPATATPYMLTSGAGNFSLGTATCVTNSDTTTDCTLPITATPTVLGQFTGYLKVTSALGGISSFYLSGVYAQSPVTRTSLSYVAASSCTGTTTYATSTPVTLTATLIANGPAPPVGSSDNITFYANNGTTNAVIGTVPVKNIGTVSSPLYGATLTYTFATPGAYTLSAVYSGDSYFKTSTGTANTSITSATPTFSTAAVPYAQATVVAGQTGLYSFTISQTVYTGTLSFACSGLPANSSCVFSPAAISATGCSVSNTVALSIITQQAVKVTPAGLGAGTHGRWQLLMVLTGFGLALVIGLRRRRVPLRHGQLWMMLALLLAASGAVACGKSVGTVLQPATPSGSYTITVTTSSSTGATSSFTVPLTVQ